ncbi:hypothetical protein INT45_006707 [Circinella minor]|uniref:Uncharacterized protein n=1 Tax=Circinella minor TaxID=1195481 RepID=A0A8H7VK98_9FUNG|nr:hypothetical protein INT45_006707 [Circinella minor]
MIACGNENSTDVSNSNNIVDNQTINRESTISRTTAIEFRAMESSLFEVITLQIYTDSSRNYNLLEGISSTQLESAQNTGILSLTGLSEEAIKVFDDIINDSGECVPKTTKDTMVILQALTGYIRVPGQEYAYENKIDLLVKAQMDKNDYDLCSNEWERSGATELILLKQQDKNLRTNATILSKLIRMASHNWIIATNWAELIINLYDKLDNELAKSNNRGVVIIDTPNTISTNFPLVLITPKVQNERLT